MASPHYLKTITHRSKTIYKRFRVVLVSYFILLAFSATAMWYWEYLPEEIVNKPEFSISFLASFLEDLIFFGVLGIVTLYITTRNPDEEDFDLRVRSLANGQGVTTEAKNYLATEVKNLLSFNELMEVVVTINAFDLQKNIIDLTIEQTKLITNMCKDVKTSFKSIITVEPGAYNEHGFGGEITHYATKDERNPRNSKVLIQSRVIRITKDTGPYTYPHTEELEISEGSRVEWKLAYRILGTFGTKEDMDNSDKWLNINANRFTKKCKLVIRNQAKSGEAIPIHVKTDFLKPAKAKKRLSSKDKDYKKDLTVNFKPKDHLSLFFEMPKQ